MLGCLLLLLVAFDVRSLSPEAIVVDKIELNHCGTGHRGFTQLIVWEWMPDYCRFRVSQWRLANGEQPIRTRGQVYFPWPQYKDDPRPYWIRSAWFEETQTSVDPELADRKFSPVQHRVCLRPR